MAKSFSYLNNENMNEIERISNNLMIIMGILMYIFGSIGNILNICVFFQWSQSKKNFKKKIKFS